jgi:hypothetical protein
MLKYNSLMGGIQTLKKMSEDDEKENRYDAMAG